VLAAAGKDTDDVLFISSQVKRSLTAEGSPACRAILNCLVNRGRRDDKHGKYRHLFEVGHSQLCGQVMPSDVYV
jgi:hypothetical protein